MEATMSATTTEKPATERVQFTDAAGRTWNLNPTVGQLKPLRAIGIDLPKLLQEPEAMGTVLFADPEKLVAALWLLCEAQADQAGISPEQFGGGFTAAVLEQAGRAIVLSAVLLCRGPKVLAASRAKLEAAFDAAGDQIGAAVAN
jgi:hypothetical protein